MPMMSKEEFIKEFTRITMNESDIDLPRELLDYRPDLLFVLYEVTLGKLTVNELNQSYLVLAGLLLGKYPKIAISVPRHDRIRLPFAALEQLPASQGKLTTHEKALFSFCVFHSVCVEVYDEKHDEIHKGITEITSRERAMNLMIYDMENHPERYEFLNSSEKSLRGQSSEPFGTSIDNPVNAISINDSYIYLNSLRTLDGKPVKYTRIGSISRKDGGIIDGYIITFTEGRTQKSIKIYIDPYSTENSIEAPEGLMLAGNSTHDPELDDLIKAAESGDLWAQFELGLKYYHGEGVEQGSELSLRALRRLKKH